ncbi:MAG: pyrroloquinoline quinone-dependent dehydrogenase [Gammaproteobacteria bacterium]|jgi:quinoprotein glucose dehydrogenase|nr:pyrroloquinoline quinone-dependent dehydrogenase [Gammaproteobacteria bacterium]MDP6617739.1 pyrroloquinoline quinone-dependent dehydrogenase [Gammaproteobacteria bacterium]MDP6694125.1 pyrroloquinoline quinone-dependent dehydrogenase [Gammaproteobacteria bacterium]MDP7041659.1 pyrroloquinoline quinone-dependent dehydrogenase [Gammaproteobacteria bacterium]
MHNRFRIPGVIAALLVGLGASSVLAGASDWPQYGGQEGGGRYSPLAQINRQNVDELELAWTYRTGAQERHPDLIQLSGYQATPILLPDDAGGHLVTCTPFNRVIALDPASGAERWLFDPKLDTENRAAGRFNCRGLSQWTDSKKPAEEFCASRIVLATNDRRLISIDARSGKLCTDFGDNGQLEVTPIILELKPANQLDGMQLMSPVAIVNDVIVIGGTANKFKDVSSMNGALRAFDVRTGEHLWTFDTLVRVGEGAVDEMVGGGNVWTTMSWDNERDLLFAPTASASPNFYGKLRPGDNRYANSILAIRASTGELVWHFQVVHHDVWDWDIPTHPLLVDITRDGEKIPVVVVLTKTGVVFVLHRDTGEPFFEVEERPVPTDGIPGEQLSPTQPFPVKPPPLMNVGITPDDAWGFTIFDRNACRDKIASMRYGGYYEPPTEQGTVMYPMIGGGNNWGGGAFDPDRNILVTPVAQVPFFIRLIPNEQIEKSDHPMAGMPMGPPDFIAGAEYGLQQGPLMSPSFSPCSKPPWAKLVGVDLDKGDIIWDRPLGVLDKLSPVPFPLEFGTPGSGGGISTGGGLVFIGASYDERFRAFDVETGKLLWEVNTPYSANATPMTYEVDGRQYVVVSAGGHAWSPLAKGDYILAFALPD